MYRFFLPNIGIAVNRTVSLDSISHQLHSVLRLQAGDQISLLDGLGFAYTTELLQLDRNRGRGKVLDKTLVTTEPWTYLTLYQCSLKADKFEWVLQKGTELGVSQFVPVIAERSVVKPASALEKKYERWQKILKEAAEQCGRGRIPILAKPLSIQDAFVTASGTKIMPWEESPTHGARRPLRSLLPTDNNKRLPQLSLLIGPEGGLTAGEAENARSANWSIASLGPRILRAETAAVAATAIIMDTMG